MLRQFHVYRGYSALAFFLGTFVALSLAAPLPAQPLPLHQRIDQLIVAGKPNFEKQAAALAADEEFLRRVYLDLAGTIPTATEARAFLKDSSSTKRQQLIERLLVSPDYALHMRDVFDVMLMERRPDKHVSQAEWREYLRASFAANKPWDQLVSEILSADGTDPQRRPSAKFILDRECEPNVLTRDISRLLLGMNLTCAQCHDHPNVSAYKQDYFYGIFAFFNRSSLFTDKGRKTVLAEKADGEVSFQSVFDPAKVTKFSGPRMPGGAVVKETTFAKGKEYEVAPAQGVRPIPKFSRRAHLAGQLASAANAQFKRNSANRLWALLMGRGLVHPLDFDHNANPPSHPELLQVLADELAAMKFDLRAFFRELALSKTYQRSSEAPAGAPEVAQDSFAVAMLKPLSPEQLACTVMQASGLTDVERSALGPKAAAGVLAGRLASNVAPFVATFGGLPGQAENQSFQASLDQALFLANGTLIRQWLSPRAGNLADRLNRLAEPNALIDELYLSVLTRQPTAAERTEVVSFLKTRGTDRAAAVQDLAWALLASAEFRFNH